MTGKGGKHAACISHLTLSCKDKVCVRTTNADAPERVAELEEFHAYIHGQQAQRRAAFLARPAGDGLIEGPDGKRVTPREVAAGYQSVSKLDRYDERRYAWTLGSLLSIPIMPGPFVNPIPPSRFRPAA